MEVGNIFVLILAFQILCGNGHEIDNTAENLENLFKTIMSELKQKDDRITALEKYTKNTTPSQIAEVAVNNNGELEELLVAMKTESAMLQNTMRRTLRAEKLIRHSAQSNMIKMLEDFRAGINQELEKMKTLMEHELEKVGRKLSIETIDRHEAMGIVDGFRADMERDIDRMDEKINVVKEQYNSDLYREIKNMEHKLEETSNRLENVSLARYEELRSYFTNKDINHNYAVGQMTWQSSTYDHYGLCWSGKAVDGSRNSYFDDRSCTHTEYQTDPWWMVDLGEVIEVGRIIIQNRGDCCGERLRNIIITVAVSKDLNGDECGRFPGPGDTDQLIEINCAQGIQGQFVRIKMDGYGVLSLCEVEVYTEKALISQYV